MPQTVQTSPTRMELLRQRQRLQVAQRAHDLLEDKRDELMQRFLPLIKEVRKLRRKVEERLNKSYADFQIAKALSSEKEVETSLMWTEAKAGLKIEGYTALKSPRFKIIKEGNLLCYGFYGTNEKLDSSLRSFSEILNLLVELSQKEEEARRLAREIERLRRRVNALEYIFIPQIREMVRYVTMKLEERERAHIINIMKIKEMMGS
ncbi:V-type ATP synthase subunit D [Candidatus Aerophobetes bacterium]|uniref:V-type ATP synthase subunit D n=2 Tax=Aerophobetes bacterium TaxID=2030807 RepID=A0A497E2X3_UNCAE|nr:MAG: V-type ATP synthase subunit D [Candidatus Aerophobetes bacterium]